ncbi:MAG: hypothetical protein IPP29_14815 [Bacteroidetes bacterium]|nr:hypothetical protein [Bacteroidota bacterium]
MKNFNLAIQRISKQTAPFILITFIFCYNSTAQWTQLGPGAGGQERAVFLRENGGQYTLYVGSDVSGV